MEKANFGQIVSFLFGIANDCLVDAPLPVKRARRSATLTSSELWCWKKVHFNT